MAFARSLPFFWLVALVGMFGCSQATEGALERDASVEETGVVSQALAEADGDEDAHEVSTKSLDMALASTELCGRSEYASSSCPNQSSSVSGWPKTPLSGTTYSTTGWKDSGQVGPGLANRWVTLTLNRTSAAGDPDLHVRKNGAVTTANYDCRPYTASNPESCAFYLESATDYLTWGVDVYSGSTLPLTVTLNIDVRACASGTVYTGVSKYDSQQTTNPPPAMKCCNCADGFSESGGECCRTVAQCEQPSDCASGFCVDGYCCDKACMGGCERCDRPQAEGLCRTLPAGSAGACSGYVCNGASASCPSSCTNHGQCAGGHYCNGSTCVPKLPNGQTCSQPAQCQTNTCSEGYCCDAACGNYLCKGWSGSCPTSCASDASCLSTAYCNASNACVPKQSLGTTCTANNQCASGSCADGVCCNSECGAPCDRCDQPGAVGTCKLAGSGTVGQPSCNPYLCDGASALCPSFCASDAGCAFGFTCSGGTCKPKASNGADCAFGSECRSGICADGVCCDTACDGGCDRCDISGQKGTCGLVTAGKPGSSCGLYLCDGKGASCPTSCVNDAHCSPNAFCHAGTCQPKSGNGAACTSSEQCGSGFCVDGTCCESACDGQCERCDAIGALGVCTPVMGKPVGMREPCTDDSKGCGGSCDGVNTASCTYPGTSVVCGGGASCTDGVAKLEGRCSGDGMCNQEARVCAPYACDAVGCRTSCESQADCSGSGECIGGQCIGSLDNGQACVAAAECKSGQCADGVCCNTACNDGCSACDTEGSVGTCRAVEKPGCSEAPGEGEPQADAFADDGGSDCGCRVVGGGPKNVPSWVMAALAIGLTVMRRRRSSLGR